MVREQRTEMESIKTFPFSWWWPEQYSKHPLMIKETLVRDGKLREHLNGLQLSRGKA